MKRILHLISHLEEGGAQRQLAYLLRFSKEYEFEIASLIASPQEKLAPLFRNSKTVIHSLSDSADFYAPEIMPNLDRLLASGRFELTHCWLYQSIVQGVLTSRKHGIPCIASPRSMHDMFRFEKNRTWETRLIRKTMQIADLVLCPSSSVALDYMDRGWAKADRIRVVRNGVDVDEFQPQFGGDSVVSVGRGSSEKSHSDFREIANQLKSKHPKIRWVVAGPPSMNLENIEFPGHQDDIRDVLKRAVIYVSTSRTEGMSNALLEAQAMGLPAVVRYLGSNSEVIRNELNGFLAANLFDFVNKSDLLLSDPSLRKEMGTAARARMESMFAIRNQTGKIESIYRELL